MPRPRGHGSIRKRAVKNAQGKIVRHDFIPRISVDNNQIEGPRCKTYQEAEKALYFLRLKYNLGDNTGVTLDAYASAWLERNKLNLKWRTYQTYKDDFNNHIAPLIGNLVMSEIKRKDIQQFINSKYAELLSKGYQGNSVVRKCVNLLHTLFEDFIIECEDDQPELNLKNPVNKRGLKIPKEIIDRPVLWTEEQIWLFLYHCASSRLFPAIYTAITTGLRQGELLALTWDDLEVTEHQGSKIGILTINKGLHLLTWSNVEEAKKRADLKHLTGRFFIGSPKTASSNSFVTVPADTIELLEIQKAIIASDRQKEGYQDYNLIFPSTIGVPLDSSNLLRDYKKLIAAAGLPEIKWHDLRDIFASYSIALNDLITVSKQLRHSSPNTTADRYTHVLYKRQLKAAMPADKLFAMDSENESILAIFRGKQLQGAKRGQDAN